MDKVSPPHSTSAVVLTPVNSQAGNFQAKTNSEGDTAKSTKRRRRRLELEERIEVACKRGRVCTSCRKRKVKWPHVRSVFRDEGSDLPSPKETNKRLKVALAYKDTNQRMNTSNRGWLTSTPEDFAETPSRVHNVKPKEMFSGAQISREATTPTTEHMLQYRPANNILQRSIDKIEDAPSDIVDLTYADDDAFYNSNTRVRSSIGSLQLVRRHQWPISETPSNDAVLGRQYRKTLSDKDPFFTTASRANGYETTPEGFFRFPWPQPFSEDLEEDCPYGCPPSSSERVLSSEDAVVQYIPPLKSDVQPARGDHPPSPNQRDRSHTDLSNIYLPSDTTPQTPSHCSRTPALAYTPSTVESQDQALAGPHEMMNTPSRRTSTVPEVLDFFGSEEQVSYGDLLISDDEFRELSEILR